MGYIDHDITEIDLQIGQTKLDQVRANGVQFIATDIDKTLVGGEKGLPDMLQLVKATLRVGIDIALITGRGASAERDMLPGLREIARTSSNGIYVALCKEQ